MPWLIVLGVVAFLLTTTKRAFGYVAGVLTQLELGSIGGGLYMRADAAAAFNRMKSAAKASGVTLMPSGIRAAFRTTEDQASLLEERGSLSSGGFAARLNYSPHQAGVAVDLVTAEGTNAAFKWLTANASAYGYQRTNAIEPWHWEYRP